MTEQMTLEKVRDWLKKPPKALENMYRGKSRKSYADEARGLAEIIDAHLNAAKGEAVSNAAKVESVAWGFQHEDTGHMTVLMNDGVNTPESFTTLNPRYMLIGPLYTHTASPDVELCSRILAMNEMAQALFGVILDIMSGDYYESNNVDIRVKPWILLFNDASEFASEWNEMIGIIKSSSMAAREGGE